MRADVSAEYALCTFVVSTNQNVGHVPEDSTFSKLLNNFFYFHKVFHSVLSKFVGRWGRANERKSCFLRVSNKPKIHNIKVTGTR